MYAHAYVNSGGCGGRSVTYSENDRQGNDNEIGERDKTSTSKTSKFNPWLSSRKQAKCKVQGATDVMQMERREFDNTGKAKGQPAERYGTLSRIAVGDDEKNGRLLLHLHLLAHGPVPVNTHYGMVWMLLRTQRSHTRGSTQDIPERGEPALQLRRTRRDANHNRNHIAIPTPFADRSDVVLGMRNMLGRTAGVGVVGVFGVVRYTMPVPVRGLSFDAELAELADVLRVTSEGFSGDREGKAMPSGAEALVTVGT